jgi:hypothetical protein
MHGVCVLCLASCETEKIRDDSNGKLTAVHGTVHRPELKQKKKNPPSFFSLVTARLSWLGGYGF